MWTITTDNYKFRILSETEKTPKRTIYRIHSKYGPCVTISHQNDELILDNVSYFPICALDKELKKRAGTTEMTQAALKFVLGLADKTKTPPTKITLSDNSHFECKPGMNVKLGEYSFATRGYTWYENHFGAKPSNPTMYIAAKARLFRKIDISFDDLRIIFSGCDTKQIIEIEKLYKTTETWFAFFTALDEKYGCVFLAFLLDELLVAAGISTKPIEYPFLIDPAIVREYSVTVKVVQNGGRFTRKRILADLKARGRPVTPKRPISLLPIEVLD